jgi:hypothetical protein
VHVGGETRGEASKRTCCHRVRSHRTFEASAAANSSQARRARPASSAESKGGRALCALPFDMPALEASPTDKHWRAPHASKARLSLVARLERDVDRFETAEDVLKASKTATAKQLQLLRERFSVHDFIDRLAEVHGDWAAREAAEGKKYEDFQALREAACAEHHRATPLALACAPLALERAPSLERSSPTAAMTAHAP